MILLLLLIRLFFCVTLLLPDIILCYLGSDRAVAMRVHQERASTIGTTKYMPLIMPSGGSSPLLLFYSAVKQSGGVSLRLTVLARYPSTSSRRASK